MYDVEPDMAMFGKALGNGYPIAAIIGKSQVMEAAQKSFISSTYWTERVGPAAAIATIKKHKRPLTITYRQQAFCWRKKFRIIIFFNKYFATFVPAIARKVQTSKAAGKKFVVG